MRARILPLDDLAEFGKTNTVALLLTLSPQEANDILSEFPDPENAGSLPHSARRLLEVLEIIASDDPNNRRRGRDILNTEGRCGRSLGDKRAGD